KSSNSLILMFCRCPGGGMADAEDLKSSGDFSSCGFDSHPGHQFLPKRQTPWEPVFRRPYEPLRLASHRRTCRGARAAHGMLSMWLVRGCECALIQRWVTLICREFNDRLTSCLTDLYPWLRRRALGFAQTHSSGCRGFGFGFLIDNADGFIENVIRKVADGIPNRFVNCCRACAFFSLFGEKLKQTESQTLVSARYLQR